MPADLMSNTGVNTVPTLIGALAASGVKLTNFTIGLPEDFSMRCEQVRRHHSLYITLLHTFLAMVCYATPNWCFSVLRT